MSDDTPGVGQGALPPREGQVLRTPTAAERPTAMRLTQVAGGQYVLTTQQSGVPALAQVRIFGNNSVVAIANLVVSYKFYLIIVDYCNCTTYYTNDFEKINKALYRKIVSLCTS